MPRIFISHASEDDADVDKLADWLAAVGYDHVFVDHRHIPPGTSWNSTLQKEAARADLLILHVTPAWLASEECFAEYRASYYGNRTVIPLLTKAMSDAELTGPSKKRFDTLSASVQLLPIQTLPPEGFVADQIEAAIARVAQARHIARRQRALAIGGGATLVLLATVATLAVTNAAYVGELLAKANIDRSFELASRTDEAFRDCDDASLCPEMVALPAASYAIGHADGLDPREDAGLASQAPITNLDIPAFAISRFEVTNRPVSLRVYPERLVIVAEGQTVCTHARIIDRSHRKPGKVIYDWHHYLAVIQRKPGALRNGAPFTEMPDIFRRLQDHMLRKEGGDREMVDILSLVLHHDESAVLRAIELALEAGVPTKTHILNLLHRLIDPKQTDHPEIDPPDALALETAPKANVDRYDDLRPTQEKRNAS